MASKPTLRHRFAQRLLKWYDRHGRRDLPWQRRRNAYRVWLSEIMLQQTQVATVLPYYERFITRFPDVQALAGAPLDEVLRVWAGLGYYARARNLHCCAQRVVAEHGAEFPRDIDTLRSLPGIGRSTAAAILAFAHRQCQPILDGNVKRVLARYHAIGGWPGRRKVESRLWALAEQHTPLRRAAAYTQAIMDLGATVCTRARPQCSRCPLATHCEAHRRGKETRYPGRRVSKPLPVRSSRHLIICNPRGEVLLERRPPAGIWGGLWSLPELQPGEDLEAWNRQRAFAVVRSESWPVFRHTFSHFHLDIHPVRLDIRLRSREVMEGGEWLWYKSGGALPVGVATPVRNLLAKLGAS
ncbi:MAG: A/G-specific adenine glycosylase [Chromatiales bacterium]